MTDEDLDEIVAEVRAMAADIYADAMRLAPTRENAAIERGAVNVSSRLERYADALDERRRSSRARWGYETSNAATPVERNVEDIVEDISRDSDDVSRSERRDIVRRGTAKMLKVVDMVRRGLL